MVRHVARRYYPGRKVSRLASYNRPCNSRDYIFSAGPLYNCCFAGDIDAEHYLWRIEELKNNSLFVSSSWGPTRSMIQKPDLVAPGVNVTGVYPIGNGTMTGTSVATAITAGACALILQWGIVEKNDVSLNTNRIKALLVRGCSRNPNITYPSPQWGYGKLDLLNTFKQLRSL